jgi:NAD-dependent dihydropyrimidine dehydrogenase PreA subunit
MPIIVDKEKCIGCGKCVDACHRKVYELQDQGGKKVAVPYREPWCLRCFVCPDQCPTNAIEIQFWKKKKEQKEI